MINLQYSVKETHYKKLILIIFLLFILLPIKTYASEFTIAQATSDERGNLRGGTAGDQNGSEVSMTSWYPGKGGFDYIIRAKNPSLAKELANNMIKASENNHIGYDQGWPARKSAYREAQKLNWDISSINNNCETTCSEVVNMCIRAAGVDEKYAPDTYLATDNLWDNVKDSGLFEKIDNINKTNVFAGDILINKGKHTAVVVKSPNKFLFNIIYKDENSNEQIIKIEEGSQIIIYNNNNTKPEILQIDKEINLNTYNPEKLSGKFVGWKYKNNKFIAIYEPEIMPIKTDAKIKKIREK